MIAWLHFIHFIECGADSCGGWGENTEGWGGCSQAHFRTSGNYVNSFGNFMLKHVVIILLLMC